MYPNLARRSMGHRGFTLIELLVVISIVSMLIALLMPALSKARKSVQNTRCLNNIRQIAMASFSYAADEKGNLPVRYANNGGWGTHGAMMYVSSLESYHVKSGMTGRYTAETPHPAWSCPSSLSRAGAHVATTNIVNVSTYAPNMGLVTGLDIATGRRVNSATEPETRLWYPRQEDIVGHSRTVLYGDSGSYFTDRPPFGYTRPGFTTFTKHASNNQGVVTHPGSFGQYLLAPSPHANGKFGDNWSPSYWHGGTTPVVVSTHVVHFDATAWGNFAWADGHASGIQPSQAIDAWLVRGAHPAKR